MPHRYFRTHCALFASFVVLSACAPATAAPLAPLPLPAPASSPSPLLVGVSAPPPILVSQVRLHASDFQAGITILLYGNDANYQSEASTLFDQLATDNVNSLSLTIPLFQSGHYATDVHVDASRTPSDAELAWLIQSAHARGFSVLLRPLIDDASTGYDYHGGWRGVIRPTSIRAWFASYDRVLLHYAAFAQANGVQSLDIGSELNSMQGYVSEWFSLLARVRVLYAGALAYSADWGSPPVNFGSGLDFLGIDAYYNVSSTLSPSIDQIVAGWHGYGLTDILHRGALAGKPVVITEVGVWPADGVFKNPYAGSSYPYNPLALLDYYTATCSALKPAVAGIYWWEVGLTHLPLPPSSSRWDPLSVPGADQAIASCYAPAFTYPPKPTPFQRHHINTD
jgi:hypothetical protein